MDLNKTLQLAGMTKWRQMARFHGLQHLEFAGNQLYQGLYHKLSNREYLTNFYKGLAANHKRIIRGVFLCQSCDLLFNTRYWDYYGLYILGATPEQMADLNETGLYFVNREQEGFLFEEMYLLMQAFFRLENNKLAIHFAKDLSMHTGGAQVIGDIVRFLAFIAARGLQLTKAGQIYKKSLAAFDQMFGLDFNQPQFVRESRLSFIVKFVTNRALVHTVNDQWQISEAGQAWLKLSGAEMWRDIFQFWRTVHHRPTESHIGACLLTSFFRNAASQDYYDQAILRHWYEENLGRIPQVYDEPDWFKATIEEMVYLGLLRRGRHQDKLLLAANKQIMAFITDPEAEFMQEDQVIIQPNFEILVSTHVQPEIIGLLAQLADDEGGREMYRFRLSKSSLYQAHMKGQTRDRVMAFLNEVNHGDLPLNVNQAISDWFSQFGQLFFMEATLLCCRTAELAQQLERNPRYEKYIISRINDRILVIQNHSKFLRELKDNHYLPYEQLFLPQNAPFAYQKDLVDPAEREEESL